MRFSVCLFLLFGFHIHAQIDPIDQLRFRRYFDLTQHDSIVELLKVNSNLEIYQQATQEYHFQDSSKIKNMSLLVFGTNTQTYSGTWNGNHAVLAAFGTSNPNDTIEKHWFHQDHAGRDSLYDTRLEYKTPNEIQVKRSFYYKPNGLLDKIVETAPVNSTEEVFYYNASDQIDSSIFYSNQEVVLKNYFDRNSSGDLKSLYILGKMPPSLHFDTVFSYLPIYNSGEVVEIEFYNHLLTAQKEFTGSVSYHTKTDSHIGVADNKLMEIEVYPNPTNGKIVIGFPDEMIGQEIRVNVHNPVGKLIYTNNFDPLDVRDYPILLPEAAGTYIISIQNNVGRVVRQKILKK